jgi:hypothetical protein
MRACIQQHARKQAMDFTAASKCTIYVQRISRLTGTLSVHLDQYRSTSATFYLPPTRCSRTYSTRPSSTPFFKMCGCTLYDSPTCGHSWLSMSQPCGFLSDLLSCPNRQTHQTLVAPPYTCPQCNAGFADRETVEMVQGPWGCNQLIRSHLGGSHAIPGSWGEVSLAMNNWSAGIRLGTAMTSMPLVSSALTSRRAMVPVNSYGFDHRLTGPYGSQPAIHGGYNSFGGGVMVDDGIVDDLDYGYDGRRRRKHSSRSKYVYRHSSKPATNCAVM